MPKYIFDNIEFFSDEQNSDEENSNKKFFDAE